MERSIVPAISKVALQCLRDLFYGALLSFEKEKVSFSKQLDIRQTFEKLQRFVLSRPYSTFTVAVIGVEDKSLVTITFDNFEEEVETLNKNQFVVHIPLTFTSFQVFLKLPDNGFIETIV